MITLLIMMRRCLRYALLLRQLRYVTLMLIYAGALICAARRCCAARADATLMLLATIIAPRARYAR